MSRVSNRLPAWLLAFVKFGIKGVAGLGTTLLLLTLFVEVGGIAERYAIIAAWAIKVVPGYLATDKWVFSALPSPDGLASHGQRGVVMYAIQWGGKAVNYGIYVALLELGIVYQGAWTVGAIVVFPLIFATNYVVWQREFSLGLDIAQVR